VSNDFDAKLTGNFLRSLLTVKLRNMRGTQPMFKYFAVIETIMGEKIKVTE